MKTALLLLAALAAGARSAVLTSVVNKSGLQITEGSPGQLSVHYEFNDRGRGPKVDERIAVGPDGVPTQLEVTGVDYYKAKVEERFERTPEGLARWKNRA